MVGLALYGLARRILGGCPCDLCAQVRTAYGDAGGRAAERRAHRAAWRIGRIRR
jgi:hypothetical protein